MKAITQIITYLRDRGALSREQLLELASGGFVPWDEVVPDPTDEAAREDAPPPEADYDDYEPPRRPRGRRGRRGQPKGTVLEAPEVGARLAARFGDWEADLAALLPLARRFAPAPAWQDAVVILRNVPADDVIDGLTEALARHNPPLDDLWRALAVDDYHDVLRGPGLHGTAVNGYHALLALDEFTPLGPYGALLKVEEVAHVFNLKQAQRRLLRAVEYVRRSRPDLIAAQLRRRAHPLAYWGLVLVYTARRGRPGRRPAPDPEECHPMHGFPGQSGWLQAWSHAAIMDPEAVPPFLVEYDALPPQRPQAVCAAGWGVLGALEPWAADRVAMYYRDSLTPGQIAAQLGVPEADVARLLATCRGAIRRALRAHPLLRVPLHGETVGVSWDAFVEEWLYWRYGDEGRRCSRPCPGATPVLDELVGRSFGPAADLVCPRSWN
jgi:hypothetical protein